MVERGDRDGNGKQRNNPWLRQQRLTALEEREGSSTEQRANGDNGDASATTMCSKCSFLETHIARNNFLEWSTVPSFSVLPTQRWGS